MVSGDVSISRSDVFVAPIIVVDKVTKAWGVDDSKVETHTILLNVYT